MEDKIDLTVKIIILNSIICQNFALKGELFSCNSTTITFSSWTNYPINIQVGRAHNFMLYLNCNYKYNYESTINSI